MGAKTWMLVYSKGNPAEILKGNPVLDQAATIEFAKRLFSSEKLTPSGICNGLMYPDTDLGENARHGEVFDEQAETYVFP